MLTDTTNTDTSGVTAGLVDRKVLAQNILPGRPVSERTVIRWEHAGLPVIKLGMIRMYDLAKVRTWLLTHERRHNVPKRGRPAKYAA
jgi:hypothetical protein